MGMMTTGSTNSSDRSARTVMLEVTGICRQDISRTSSYKIKVPYSRLSQTMQGIQRIGGKVIGVDLPTAGVTTASTNVKASAASKDAPKKELPVREKGGRKK